MFNPFRCRPRSLSTVLIEKAAVERQRHQYAEQARLIADLMDANKSTVDGPTALREFAVFLEDKPVTHQFG